MDRDTELDVVRRLAARDAAAFDAVYAEYHGRVFGFLARLSRRRDVAEDLAEETWMRLVIHAPRLRPDTCLGPWLFTVARRLYISYCRSRMVEDAGMGSLLGLWPSHQAAVSPFEAAAVGELERCMEDALTALPAKYREVLLLVGVEGFTPAEAAAICGIRPDTFRQQLSRARTMLSRAMEARPGMAGQTTCEVPA
jgi:RNA polymerase sigma-70 factor (ECF subfamily)